MTASKQPHRPLIRYHGGKFLLAPWIISHFRRHRTSVEPYGGGASVLLRKPRCALEIYNDLDPDLFNLFLVARDHGRELMHRVFLTPFARDEFMLSYEEASNPIERARRTLVRSWMGFGSNALSDDITTGFRATTRVTTPPCLNWRNFPPALQQIVDRLRGVVIENADALEVMTRHDSEETLHYVDPPYVQETRSGFDGRHSYRHEMTDDDHRRLAEFLRTLEGQVIVSGYDCPLYRELFHDWHRVEKRAWADGGRQRTEVLWLRNVPELYPQLPLF